MTPSDVSRRILANQSDFNGRIVSPLKIRCKGVLDSGENAVRFSDDSKFKHLSTWAISQESFVIYRNSYLKFD